MYNAIGDFPPKTYHGFGCNCINCIYPRRTQDYTFAFYRDDLEIKATLAELTESVKKLTTIVNSLKPKKPARKKKV